MRFVITDFIMNLLKHHQKDKVIILFEDHSEKLYGFYQYSLQSLMDLLENIFATIKQNNIIYTLFVNRIIKK